MKLEIHGASGKKEKQQTIEEISEQSVADYMRRTLGNLLPKSADEIIAEMVKFNFVFKGADPIALKKLLQFHLHKFSKLIALEYPTIVAAIEKRTSELKRKNDYEQHSQVLREKEAKAKKFCELAKIEHEKSDLARFRQAALELLPLEDFMMIRDLADERNSGLSPTL